MNAALGLFQRNTAKWFEEKVGRPTSVQEEGWPAIHSGEDVLISAPTGTGKTLAAFLIFIDRLKKLAEEGSLESRTYLIYISPLKALGNDIRENLRRPLEGIACDGEEIRVGVRSGDTTAYERQKMLKNPPHILITTPESLYLLLTSQRGRQMLSRAQAVILDELHAVINSKRGAHLMLSLARLDEICQKSSGRKPQRIGLSATIDPLETAAEYFSPGKRAQIIAPNIKKNARISVESPLEDMRTLPEGTIWPEIARCIVEKCLSARTVLVFAEGRQQAERLAHLINSLAGENFARTHHGCVSKEQRLEAEQQLKSGQLRVMCATSSMELGIDVGEIDLVVQVGFPSAVSSAMQRLGRAGHSPGKTSFMAMFPRTAGEGLFCGMTAAAALEGGMERSRPPMKCLDVLAQHIVSMAAVEPLTVDGILRTAHHAYNFMDITKKEVEAVLRMLAGDYEHELDHPVRPRVLYDRISGSVAGDNYSRMLAVSAGGTIPDRGWYAVRLLDGTRLGELDEEFVYESRVGDKFLLGAFAWRITQINRDSVTVVQTDPAGARPPFWRGDSMGRSYQTGLTFGKYMRGLMQASEAGDLKGGLKAMRMDDYAAENARRFVERQISAAGCMYDDKTILIEHFTDHTGSSQMMIHSIFGRRVNAGLSMLLQEAAKRATGMDVYCFEDDDGILLYPYGSEGRLPFGLLKGLSPQSARVLLEALLPSSPLFNMAFRYNAARALMMGARKGGRQPLWVQRLRGAQALDNAVMQRDHPLMEETRRECLEDYWDIPAIEEVLWDIRSGKIRVREMSLPEPSPMSLTLRRQVEMFMIYDFYPTTSNVHRAVDMDLENMEMIAPGKEQLEMVSERRITPKDMARLHSLLMAEGDMVAGEIDAPHEWFEDLAQQSRLVYIEPGLWICKEQEEQYGDALSGGKDALVRIIRRCLRYRGPQDKGSLSERYFLPEDICEAVLLGLAKSAEAVFHEPQGLYYHAQLYGKAQRETVFFRRQQAKTQPPERFAAFICGRAQFAGGASDQLSQAVQSLLDMPLPLDWWESFVLPARVSGYRPAMLDELLSRGEIFWWINPGEKATVSFHSQGQIDWALIPPGAEGLSGDEKAIADALGQRGASFAQSLSYSISGRPPLDALLSLAEKGIAHADSFQPVRQLLMKEKLKLHTPRARARSRVMAAMAGRWELCRPLLPENQEDEIERAFERYGILCRESCGELRWPSALEILRRWEYTGRVRRGYFVKGLSGAQFIRAQDYDGVVLALERPREELIWLSAADPFQPWGRIIPHSEGKSFICLPSTSVAIKEGAPVAVMERQGSVFRELCYDPKVMEEALKEFALAFQQKRIFPDTDRITVKTYSEKAEKALGMAGFTKQMLDYVLWRKSFI
ncbi:MAG: DEAD/DEAH box helicase [Christensenellales bacterium]|jgi:ATP-dependent Lhr-like helicase